MNHYLIPLLCLLFLTCNLSSQEIIWEENFSDSTKYWQIDTTNCDNAPSFFGVRNDRFEVQDMEGSPCCAPAICGNTGCGGNFNSWQTENIYTSAFSSLSLAFEYGSSNNLECEFDTITFGCVQAIMGLGNIAHDQMVFEVSLDNAAWQELLFVCGVGAGIEQFDLINADSVRIRVLAANKALNELYWFDNISLSGIPDCDGAYLQVPLVYQDTIRAEIHIESDASVNSTEQLLFTAGSDLEFLIGFEVYSGTTFEAKIEPCEN